MLADYMFVAEGNRALMAHFAPAYTIDAAVVAGVGGNIAGTGAYAVGSSVTLVATPDDGLFVPKLELERDVRKHIPELHIHSRQRPGFRSDFQTDHSSNEPFGTRAGHAGYRMAGGSPELESRREPRFKRGQLAPIGGASYHCRQQQSGINFATQREALLQAFSSVSATCCQPRQLNFHPQAQVHSGVAVDPA